MSYQFTKKHLHETKPNPLHLLFFFFLLPYLLFPIEQEDKRNDLNRVLSIIQFYFSLPKSFQFMRNVLYTVRFLILTLAMKEKAFIFLARKDAVFLLFFFSRWKYEWFWFRWCLYNWRTLNFVYKILSVSAKVRIKNCGRWKTTRLRSKNR